MMPVTHIYKLSLGALALVLIAFVPARAEPLKIRIGWIGAPGQLVAFMFAKQGLAKHLGQSYTFEPLHFSASPLQISALAAGEL